MLNDRLMDLCLTDIKVLKEKTKTYGDSWKKRGGVGAFMMLARKWDRIENMVKADNWDIFVTGDTLEDIADLRRYLLLVEDHIQQNMDKGCEPGPGYVDQDHVNELGVNNG